MKRAFYILIFLLIASGIAVAQSEDKSCAKNLRYVNKNQVDPPPLRLRSIAGRTIDLGSVAVPGVCVALYQESDHKFVASTIADSDGRFRFGKVSDGRYRMVITVDYDFLCPANSIVIVSGKNKSRSYRSHVVVHLRAVGIDTCSYSDYK